MKYLLLFSLPAFILLRGGYIFPQSFDADQSGKVGDAVANISASIISDSLVPMTHYKEGEYRISVVPAYFDVNTAYNDPEILGDDLKGWSAGLGGAYAVNDRLMFYGILAHMKIDGKAEGSIYGDDLSSGKSDVDYDYTAFCAGAGYDLLRTGKWSAPLYAGGLVQHYDAEFAFDELDEGARTCETVLTSDSFLFGMTLSAALSYRIKNMILITPYLLYMQNFNSSKGNADISGNTGGIPFSETDNFEIDRISAVMPGLSLTFVSKKKFSVSLSAGGYVSSSTGRYNELFLDGLNMKSLVAVFTYNNWK